MAYTFYESIEFIWITKQLFKKTFFGNDFVSIVESCQQAQISQKLNPVFDVLSVWDYSGHSSI